MRTRHKVTIKERTMQNPFTRLFTAQESTQEAANYADKFTPKPYQVAYRTVYRLAVGAGYMLHAAAAAAVAYYLFKLLEALAGTTAAAAVGIVVAVLVEAIKRATAERVAVSYLMYRAVSVLAFVSLSLAAVSTYAAYQGAEKAVITAHGDAPTTDATEQTAPHYAQIKAATEQISSAKKQTWQGKLTPAATRQIERAQKQIETAQNRIAQIETRTEAANDRTEIAHTATATGNGRTFGLLMLLCELLIIVCICYANYYQYRTVKETRTMPTKAPGTTITPPPVSTYQPEQNGARVEIRGFLPNSKSCVKCGKGFTPNHKKQIYCTTGCRVTAHADRTARKPPAHWLS